MAETSLGVPQVTDPPPLPLGPPPDSRESLIKTQVGVYSLIKTQVEVYSLIKTKAKGLCYAQTQSSSHAGSADISKFW